jgi:hypothetical protein
MSQRPLSLSPDLWRLRNEGYDLEIKSGHLLVKDVPYLNSQKQVKRGMIVTVLSATADVATKPADHTIWFAGEPPCDKDGAQIPRNETRHHEIAPGIVVDHYFSRKPAGTGAYNDFYEKIKAYDALFSSPAAFIDKTATAKTFPVYEDKDEESVFRYIDTASSRAGIAVISAKLELAKIAIVGIGGTGSYVLDLVSKTPVKEIHLYDGDMFLQHNAFRCPGAASIEELQKHQQKADYFKDKYSNLHLGIKSHTFVTDANVGELKDMNFVFLCLDSPEAKKLIVEKLQEFNVPFVDVGMGIYEVEANLGGTLRTTTSTPNKRDHVHARNRIPLGAADPNNEYSRNIQIADLNALNACLAVVKWKKLFGFYQDLKKEHFATYHIVDNRIVNEDQA